VNRDSVLLKATAPESFFQEIPLRWEQGGDSRYTYILLPLPPAHLWRG
jgi:hypothetical protein